MTVWLSRRVILAIHDEQLAEHGGRAGIRDEGLLESALARPLNRASYGEPGIADLAAVYAQAIVHNHPFVDGNKRTGFAALPSVPMKMRHRPAGDLDLRARKDHLAHADAADTDRCRSWRCHERRP